MKQKKKAKRDIKKTLFSVVVLLIILSFAASFFASGITAKSAAAAQTQPPGLPEPSLVLQPSTEPTPSTSSTVDFSAFLTSIKSSMVVNESPAANAAMISGAINTYNAFFPENIILNDESFPAVAIAKLTDAGIYFDEIASDAETAAWDLIVIDENGKATVK